MNLYTASSLTAALFCFGLAAIVFLRRGTSKERFAFSAVTFLIGLWTFFPYWTAQANAPSQALFWTRALYIPAIFVPALFYKFMLHTMGIAGEPKVVRILKFSYAGAFFFLLLAASPLFIRDVTVSSSHTIIQPGWFYPLFILYFGFMYFDASTRLLRLYRTATGHFREHLKYIGLAFVIAFFGGTIHFASAYHVPEIIPHDFLVIGYSAIIAFAIIRHRIMDFRIAIARTIILIAVYTFVLGIPFFGYYFYRAQLNELIKMHPVVTPMLIAAYAILASCVPFVYLFLQRRAEDRLLAESHRYQAILRQASQGMTLIKELGKLLNLIVHLLTQKVRIRHAAVYLWDEQGKQFIHKVSRQWNVAQPPVLGREEPLAQYFHLHRSAIITEEIHSQVRSGARELQPVRDALRQLEAAVLVPSFVEDRCQGFLTLGEKIAGDLYTQDDLQVFQVLASQAALAIENAQFYEELKRTQADLFQTAKMASLGHMAGGMSHQVNNRFHVLTILAGTLKSVLKELDPTQIEAEKLKTLWDKTIETLAKVEENALRGGDIVKTLLKFSRPAGDYEPVALGKIVQTAKDVVQFRANLNLMDLIEEIPEALPPVRGSLNQLSDCCFNLISNTFDATQKKVEMIEEGRLEPASADSKPYKGRLKIQGRTEVKEDQTWAVLEFNDNGIGMTQEDLDSLFVPFFTTKATAEKGTGLGLYIIQRIIQQHGGSINATSTYGVGTTFTIWLPVGEVAPKKEAQPQHA